MAHVKRRLLVQTAMLGVVLVLLVLLAFHFELLHPVENLAWDRRALYCQWFAKPPTTQVVHVDIDDRALEVIGSWPWPRSELAEITDELSRAKPKVMAMDIIFSDAQKVLYEPQPGGGFLKIDNDAQLAAALKRAGNMLIGGAFDFGETRVASPLEKLMVTELAADPELSIEQVVSRVIGKGQSVNASAVEMEAMFIRARRDAVYQRINAMMDKERVGLDEVIKTLLKKDDPQLKTPLRKMVEEQYEYVAREHELQRLSWPLPPNPPPLLHAEKFSLVPIARYTQVAGLTGYFNYSFLDGPVRSIPLVIEYRGRIYPQLALSLACRYLDIDPATVQFTQDEVVLPRPGGQNIVIPVHPDYSHAIHQMVPMLADVPWFGTSQWETMYDFPNHVEFKQHISITGIWDIIENRRKIIRNNAEIDKAIRAVMGDPDEKTNPYGMALEPDRAKAYFAVAHAPEDTVVRREIAAAAAKELKDSGWLEQFAQIKNPTPTEADQLYNLLASQHSLKELVEQNASLQVQLNAQRERLATTLGDKAVLMGYTASGFDFVPTSIHSRAPGVVVHGVLVNGILTNTFARRAPAWLTYLLIVGMGLLSVIAATLLPPLRALLVSLGISAIYLTINLVVLFAHAHVILNITAVLAAVTVGWAGCSLMRFLIEAKERARITRRFSTYVDPSLVNFVVEHPDVDVFEGQVREMTVVFSDLAGFTTISEKLGEQSVALLNEYLEVMVPIIRAGGAYLNKFLGDGIMFFYGAPKLSATHAPDAVRTALKLQAAMREFNERIQARGLGALGMRIGVATGKMVVGDAGSRDMHDYTVLGDTVNLAARLESANKATGTNILISGRTVELLNGEFLVRPIAKLQVKGKSEGIVTYDPICLAKDATPDDVEQARLNQCVFDAYSKGRFIDCLAALQDVETKTAACKLTELYRTVCEKYLKNAPEGTFDGHIVLESK